MCILTNLIYIKYKRYGWNHDKNISEVTIGLKKVLIINKLQENKWYNLLKSTFDKDKA